MAVAVHARELRKKGAICFAGFSWWYSDRENIEGHVDIRRFPHVEVVMPGPAPDGVLPSLSAFDRHRHRAVLFDEARSDQVLTNRELFQSSQYPQKLSQSICNQHAYSIWNYGTAMILCSNLLATTVEEGLCPEDAEWMGANVNVIRLAPGQRWYIGMAATAACAPQRP